MYEKVSNKKKWKVELISISRSEAGGLKIIASIKGTNIYSTLKYESGVHRVKECQTQKLRVEYTPLQQQSQYYQRQRR